MRKWRIFKLYRITEHINNGYMLEHRPHPFAEWQLLLIYPNKTNAIDGIRKHKQIRAEYY